MSKPSGERQKPPVGFDMRDDAVEGKGTEKPGERMVLMSDVLFDRLMQLAAEKYPDREYDIDFGDPVTGIPPRVYFAPTVSFKHRDAASTD